MSRAKLASRKTFTSYLWVFFLLLFILDVLIVSPDDILFFPLGFADEVILLILALYTRAKSTLSKSILGKRKKK